MIDVGELVRDLAFAEAIVIKRPTLALANEGVLTTTYTTINTSGIVQPANPGKLVGVLPEGIRADDVVVVWSTTELRGTDGDAAGSDVITCRGQSYQVIKARDFSVNGYWQAWATGFAP